MPCCPTCGKGIREPAPPRRRVCNVCGKEFLQSGRGRSRVICGNKDCLLRYHQRFKAEVRELDRVVD